MPLSKKGQKDNSTARQTIYQSTIHIRVSRVGRILTFKSSRQFTAHSAEGQFAGLTGNKKIQTSGCIYLRVLLPYCGRLKSCVT